METKIQSALIITSEKLAFSPGNLFFNQKNLQQKVFQLILYYWGGA